MMLFTFTFRNTIYVAEYVSEEPKLLLLLLGRPFYTFN